jgi:adenosylhomocysteine nucleosidase
VRAVLVLTAVDVEARGLARHLALSRVLSSDFPHFAGGALEIACVGLRAGHIARAERCRAPSLVISAGTCGALAPALVAGDLVVPETVLGPAGVRYTTAPLPGNPAAGTLVTVTDIVHSGAQKTRLWMESGALAVDMESAAIVGWAQARGVMGAVVRAVSDTSERGVPADLAAVVADDGRVRTLRAVSAVLARPRAAADAMALRSTTNVALKVIAQALGRIVRLQ